MSRHFPSKLLATALLAFVMASCGPKTESLQHGRIVPREDGFDLPIVKKTGKKAVDYTVGIAFAEDKLFMLSKRDLYEARVSFFYMNGEERRIKDCDLDFLSKNGDLYVYGLPYNLLLSKTHADNVKQVLFAYVPKDVTLPQVVEENGADREVYPDFTGYYFVFNEDEYQTYFEAFRDNLK